MTRIELLAFSALVTITLWAQPASAGPCVTTTACTEWVTVGGGPSRVLIYGSYPMTAKNEAITRALVMIHGSARDADNYYRSAIAAAFLAGALDDTIVIAPRFASNDTGSPNCKDTRAPNELNWHCEPHAQDWRYGGTTAGGQATNTFDVIDEVLRRVARKDVFPNLRVIVVAGHSGGGSFVSRYEAVNSVHDSLGVPITYVAANAASYIYFDALRPTAAAYPIAAGAPGFVPPVPAEPFVEFQDAAKCTGFDAWPYGLRDRRGGSVKVSEEKLKTQLVARPITYLVGQLDILPLATFDGSCSAMAQGPTRMARALAYDKYLKDKYPGRQQTIVVALCGHNARCMFTAEPVLPIIFPKPQTSAR